MTDLAITPFLSSPEQVVRALSEDVEFQQFLAIALKSSGEVPQQIDLHKARFRVTDSRLGLLDDLEFNARVMVWGQPVQISELLAVFLTIDRTQLVHSLWRLQDFEEVKAWLKAVQVMARFTIEPIGILRGHLLLAESLIPMVETIERKDYVLPNGEMASDALTRNYGLRAKVFALDRARRVPHMADGSLMMDRLSRTLNRANR